ncbi:hypothetical protein LXL04_010938 [Taraxacum kok-saghyz]
MSGGIPYVISLKAVSSASSFSRSSAVGGKVPSSAPRACSAGVASLAAAVPTCGPDGYQGLMTFQHAESDQRLQDLQRDIRYLCDAVSRNKKQFYLLCAFYIDGALTRFPIFPLPYIDHNQVSRPIGLSLGELNDRDFAFADSVAAMYVGHTGEPDPTIEREYSSPIEHEEPLEKTEPSSFCHFGPSDFDKRVSTNLWKLKEVVEVGKSTVKYQTFQRIDKKTSLNIKQKLCKQKVMGVCDKKKKKKHKEFQKNMEK